MKTVLAAVVVCLAVGVSALAATSLRDDRASEIALRSVEAMEREWALTAYDAIDQLRAAIDMSGGSANRQFMLTSDLAVDKPSRRVKVDASGDVGPVTLFASEQKATLFAPALQQYASKALEPKAGFKPTVQDHVEAVKLLLETGSVPLEYLGEEPVESYSTHRIRHAQDEETMVDYWIDIETDLPRRIEVTKESTKEVRLDLYYEMGSQPSRLEAEITRNKPVHVTLKPQYEASGRVSKLQMKSTLPKGEVVANVDLDWMPTLSPDFFEFSAPEGAREVKFEQLVSGLVIVTLGKLGPVLRDQN